MPAESATRAAVLLLLQGCLKAVEAPDPQDEFDPFEIPLLLLGIPFLIDPLDDRPEQVVFVAIQRPDFTHYHLSLLITPHVVATFSRGSTGIASRKSVSPSS